MAGSTRPTPARAWRRRALTAVMAAAAVLAVGAGTAAAVIPGTQPPGPPPQQARDLKEIAVHPLAPQPESVVYDEKDKAFYASSENTGAITKGYLHGRPSELFLAPVVPDMRRESNGLTLDDRGRLYVAGGVGGELFVYDTATRKLVAQFRTGLGGFLNDVTVTKSGDVYATDSFRPRIYRVSAQQVDAGGGEPEIIRTDPEVATSPLGSNPPKPFNANGIRESPDGKYIVFDDLNDAALYRMTPPPPGKPGAREIRRVAVSGGSLGDADGLEFVGDTLYVADNGGERILKLKPGKDLLTAVIESATTSPAFHTPTAAAKGPGDTLLVSNSELFDPNGPPFFVDSIKRP